MKKLSILLFIMFPFFVFSQNNSLKMSIEQSPPLKIVSTKIYGKTANKSNEMSSYFEDYFKMYDGSQEWDFMFEVVNETLDFDENSKIYEEVDVLSSEDKTVTNCKNKNEKSHFPEKQNLVIN